MDRPLKVFLSYAHADETDGQWKTQVATMLRSLVQDGIVELFEDGMFEVSADWDETIRDRLTGADLAIFLVSPSFNASPYISHTEVALACDKRDRGELRILPIIVKACDWQYKRWARVDALPKTGGSVLPLEEWERPHQALGDISRKIRDLHRSWSVQSSRPQTEIPLGAPYRGLSSFDRQHADDFFGREQLVDQLWQRLSDHPLVLLTGPSGSGKSSLIHAGIEPRLTDDGNWCIARFSPRAQPMHELAKALVTLFEPMTPRLDIPERAQTVCERLIVAPSRLSEHALGHFDATGKKLFLIVDQMEESFNLARQEAPEQHRALIRALNHMARTTVDAPYRVLVAFRSDFLTALIEDDPEFVDAIQSAELKVRRMTPTELTQAITGPAARRGVEIDIAVTAQIIAEIEANPDALPLVEVALEELWQHRRHDRIGSGDLEAIGGVAGALAAQADRAMQQCGIDERDGRELFLRLVHLRSESAGVRHATRHPRHRSELGESLWQTAERLRASRLIAIDGTNPQDPSVDITHESLFRRWPRLRSWIEDHQDDLILIQAIEARRRDWIEHDRHDDYAWPASDTERALELHGRGMLNRDQSLFIEASTRQHSAHAADVASTSYWLSLELNWRGRQPDPHELVTLRAIAGAPAIQRAAMLRAALTNVDRSRKFQHEPAILLRVLGGLDIDGARDLLDRLDECATSLSEVRCLAKSRLVLASWSAPFDGRMVQPALHQLRSIVGQSNAPQNLAACAVAIEGLANHIPNPELDDLAVRVVEHSVSLLNGAGSKPLANSLGAVIGRLARFIDTPTADRVARRVFDDFSRSLPSPPMPNSVQAIVRLASRMSPGAIDGIADALIAAIPREDAPARLRSRVQILRGLAPCMSPVAAGEGLAQLERHARRPQEIASRRATAAALDLLAGLVTGADVRETARMMLQQVAPALSVTREPVELLSLARTVRSLSGHAVDDSPREFAGTIALRAIDLAERIELAPLQSACANAVMAVAFLIDAEAGRAIAGRAARVCERITSASSILTWCRVIGQFLAQAECNEAEIREWTEMIGDVVERSDDAAKLAALTFVVDGLSAGTSRHGIEPLPRLLLGKLVIRGILAADTETLRSAAGGVIALKGHLPRQIFLQICIILLRQPLCGDEATTVMFLDAIEDCLGIENDDNETYYHRFWKTMTRLGQEPGLAGILRPAGAGEGPSQAMAPDADTQCALVTELIDSFDKDGA
ncbi:MAG: toll/interleukin-1 receptor domain-containing protein [Geminicoccaceae bacterium]